MREIRVSAQCECPFYSDEMSGGGTWTGIDVDSVCTISEYREDCHGFMQRGCALKDGPIELRIIPEV